MTKRALGLVFYDVPCFASAALLVATHQPTIDREALLIHAVLTTSHDLSRSPGAAIFRALLVTGSAWATMHPSDASAMPSFVYEIPNGDNRALTGGLPCQICHERISGGEARNVFGRDFDDLAYDWARLYARDSDGDGLTNGEELGDPEGRWSPGEAPARRSGLSLPGDPLSGPATGDAGVSVDQGSSEVDVGGTDASRADSGAPRDAAWGRLDAGLSGDAGRVPFDASSTDDAPAPPPPSGGGGCACARVEAPSLLLAALAGLAGAWGRRGGAGSGARRSARRSRGTCRTRMAPSR